MALCKARLALRRCGTPALLGHYETMQNAGHQVHTKAALRRRESRLNEVLDSVSDGFLTLDSGWRFGNFNRAAEIAFAIDRTAVLGRVIWEVFPALLGSDFELRLRNVATQRQEDTFELTALGRHCLSFAVRATPEPGGGVSVLFSDITAQKYAEIERRLLIDELNHRVKNTLSVVQSLAVQSFRSQDSVETARRAFEGRLATLSGAHGLLTDRNWHSASLGDVVEAAIAATADRERFSVAGPFVALAPQTVVSLALALHELCANAVKHGALRTPEGRVTVRWAMASAADGTERLHFDWRETGGPAAFQPATRGFGSRLLERAFTSELRGRIDFDFTPEGLRCTVDAPVPMGY